MKILKYMCICNCEIAPYLCLKEYGKTPFIRDNLFSCKFVSLQRQEKKVLGNIFL